MKLPNAADRWPAGRAASRLVVFALLTTLVAGLVLGGCSQANAPLDSSALLRQEVAEKTDRRMAEDILVPFELNEEILARFDELYKPAPRELYRIEQVNDFIFRKQGLEYSLTPTRSATGTFRARQGNCLSFVNLFVGVARHNRLAPFYVEVTDHQRWRHEKGMVLSQGHIVAGMYVGGELQTFDFLPYQPKSYKDFKPIDDITATAHYYNNLAAEALMSRDDLETAEKYLAIATDLAPDFEKALNNLGVVRARRGDVDGAFEAYRRGLEGDPNNVPILSNMARLYQQQGEPERAEEALARVEGAQTRNPFYYVYRADLALARDDPAEALEHMRQALRIDTEIPEVHLGLARTYLALGEMEKTRHHVERALKLDATHPEARELATILGPPH